MTETEQQALLDRLDTLETAVETLGEYVLGEVCNHPSHVTDAVNQRTHYVEGPDGFLTLD